MAMPISKILPFFFFFLLSFLTVCSSGTQISLSDDATQIKVLVTDDRILKTLCNSGVLVDIVVDEYEIKNLRKSTDSLVLWLETHLVNHLPCINITSIIVSSKDSDLGSLLASLKSVHSALRNLGLNREVKVSVAFSQLMLGYSRRRNADDLNQVVDFIRECGSFIVLETEIDDALRMGDHFVGLMMKSALSAATLLHYKDVPIVLSVGSSGVTSSVEVVEFSERMMRYIKSHEHVSDRISGVFAQISFMEGQKAFHGSRRELLDDDLNAQTPLTIPQPSPVPTIVTIPATNPVVTSPENSATNPTATPITTPPANPVATPSMMPPLGNQSPPFVTVPVTPPTFNPAPPTGGIPITPPTGAVPITPPSPIVNPVTPPTVTNPPTTSGQAWCVAKTGASQSALQAGIDYACGLGGADCSAIQPSGSCYNPNSPQNHASYAFNSYYQKNPAPTSCDFKGAATLVNSNPSTGSCIYPSSSSSSSSVSPPTTPLLSPPSTPLFSSPPPVTMSPSPPTTSSLPPTTTSTPATTPPTTTSSGTGMPPLLLNSSDPDPSAPMYGLSPPPGASTSVSIAASLRPLFISIILVLFVVAGNLL